MGTSFATIARLDPGWVGASGVTGVSMIGDLPDRAGAGFVQAPKSDLCGQAVSHGLCPFYTHNVEEESSVE